MSIRRLGTVPGINVGIGQQRQARHQMPNYLPKIIRIFQPKQILVYASSPKKQDSLCSNLKTRVYPVRLPDLGSLSDGYKCAHFIIITHLLETRSIKALRS